MTDRLKISSSVMEKRLMLFSSLKHSYLEKQMHCCFNWKKGRTKVKGVPCKQNDPL